ncbi:putative ATPase [Brockia lithotrophica]|uniref:Putative ATPase n=2 Tax=Brockia lithotrophica TaxID=933949 RepID=A0A660L792_9BACL|nr:putative ATPase [Brockia lithotrophica]
MVLSSRFRGESGEKVKTMDLFDFREPETERIPLAERLRPQTLDEIVGQEHILAPGKLLRRAIEADRLTSLILYGPPGTGKTTLARVIAAKTKARFVSLSGVTAGVTDLRREIDAAREELRLYGRRTVLFVDEIHRWTRAQQDVLLPFLEDGSLILIGATTENPFFALRGALLSRSLVFELRPLSEEALRTLAERALRDPRGLGKLGVEIDADALAHLIRTSGGDARRFLNALELAALTARVGEGGTVRITLADAEESVQRSAVRYDADGDAHYDVVSAFIKSIRGSDPDAALYWLARMLDAGEDPLFIARRLVIAASEDIGNADPHALPLAVAAFEAVERIGMPEGRIPLAQVTAYLALAPKSNSSYRAIGAYLEWIREHGAAEVPPHLRDAHYSGAKRLGRGEGYLYPHDYPDHFVVQEYLPQGVPRLFRPGSLGWEGRAAELHTQRWGSPETTPEIKGGKAGE